MLRARQGFGGEVCCYNIVVRDSMFSGHLWVWLAHVDVA
jgi:hypothetical protein